MQREPSPAAMVCSHHTTRRTAVQRPFMLVLRRFVLQTNHPPSSRSRSELPLHGSLAVSGQRLEDLNPRQI